MAKLPISLNCPHCSSEEAMRLESESRNSLVLLCSMCGHVVQVVDATLRLISLKDLADFKIRLARRGLVDWSDDIWRRLCRGSARLN